MLDPEIGNIIRRFIRALSERGVRIEKVLLYGSFASGNIHAGSDLDLAIVSPDFGKDRFEEGKMLNRMAWRIDPRIEAIPLSSDSFENDTWVPLIHEIRSKGIEVRP